MENYTTKTLRNRSIKIRDYSVPNRKVYRANRFTTKDKIVRKVANDQEKGYKCDKNRSNHHIKQTNRVYNTRNRNKTYARNEK